MLQQISILLCLPQQPQILSKRQKPIDGTHSDLYDKLFVRCLLKISNFNKFSLPAHRSRFDLAPLHLEYFLPDKDFRPRLYLKMNGCLFSKILFVLFVCYRKYEQKVVRPTQSINKKQFDIHNVPRMANKLYIVQIDNSYDGYNTVHNEFKGKHKTYSDPIMGPIVPHFTHSVFGF